MEYDCTIIRWLDGDTCEVSAAVDWIGTLVTFQERVRVDGINSPELHSTDRHEKEAGLAAKQHAEVLAPPASKVKVRSANPNEPREKFGRWLAALTLADGTDYAKRMIADGFAKPYHGEKR